MVKGKRPIGYLGFAAATEIRRIRSSLEEGRVYAPTYIMAYLFSHQPPFPVLKVSNPFKVSQPVCRCGEW